jgi:hypothetical protein
MCKETAALQKNRPQDVYMRAIPHLRWYATNRVYGRWRQSIRPTKFTSQRKPAVSNRVEQVSAVGAHKRTLAHPTTQKVKGLKPDRRNPTTQHAMSIHDWLLQLCCGCNETDEHQRELCRRASPAQQPSLRWAEPGRIQRCQRCLGIIALQEPSQSSSVAVHKVNKHMHAADGA